MEYQEYKDLVWTNLNPLSVTFLAHNPFTIIHDIRMLRILKNTIGPIPFPSLTTKTPAEESIEKIIPTEVERLIKGTIYEVDSQNKTENRNMLLERTV